MHYSLTDSNFLLENLASIRFEQLLFEHRIKTVLSKMRQYKPVSNALSLI